MSHVSHVTCYCLLCIVVELHRGGSATNEATTSSLNEIWLPTNYDTHLVYGKFVINVSLLQVPTSIDLTYAALGVLTTGALGSVLYR